ncbi:unnamed protein product [Phaedon cochleariae]|uniref:Uncharacterized protein n=1 Tax=Phaedon cochleariae TaxID=80249 RepID=A0A9N9SI75_PHACE|nr:unnamed protein product [Phaedon cochleariae]
MNSYFDSDEEIAFGPISLKEVKFDLNRPRFKKVDRRHTTALKIIDNKEAKKEPSPEETMKPGIENISPVPDDYFTAIDSARSEFCSRNRNCIPDSSVYFTAAESTIASQNTDCPYLSAENTMCFVNAALNLKTDFDLEGDMSRMLVENTVYSQSNIPVEKLDESSCSNTSGNCAKVSSENSNCKKNTTCISSDSLDSAEDEVVIIISSDDESFDEIVDKHGDEQSILKMKEENPSHIFDVSIDQDNYSSGSSIDEEIGLRLTISSNSISDEEVNERVNSNDCLLDYKDIERGSLLDEYPEDGKNILSVIPEETKSTYDLVETRKNTMATIEASVNPSTSCRRSLSDSFISSEEKADKDETPGTRNERNISGITLPEIDLAQFDESSQLNDTIELMDRMLRQAEQAESTRNRKEEEKENQDIENNWRLKTDDIISASFLQQETAHTKDRSPCGSQKSRIPTLRRRSQSLDDFKVPQTPLSQKTRSASKPLTGFKNIASPVGLYIKYSPKPLLRQNVIHKEISTQATPTTTKTLKHKDLNKEIGFVRYKPAKKQVCTSGNKLFCPPYIQKMMKDPLVIKHEKKIVKQESSFITEQKLLANDLTRPSISDSLLNDSNQDVSILKEKTALRK